MNMNILMKNMETKSNGGTNNDNDKNNYNDNDNNKNNYNDNNKNNDNDNNNDIVFANSVINYEITDISPIVVGNEKNEIDNLLNDNSFFNDFKLEFDSFDDDNMMAQHIDYFENYNVKQLHHISNYYQIPKRKMKKEELIEVIIQFENDENNMNIVYNRKRLWHYLMELKEDTYFSKFVIF